VRLLPVVEKKKHDVDVYVGHQIKKYRSFRKYTQAQIGELLGISFQQVQKYEQGKNRISASKLYELSKILKIPINSFYEGLDDSELQGKEFQHANLLLLSMYPLPKSITERMIALSKEIAKLAKP